MVTTHSFADFSVPVSGRIQIGRCPSGDPLYALARTKPVVLALRVMIGSAGK